MTDNELLTAAARAAGMDLDDGAFGLLDWWNPLREDSDALRLAVKLGLGISIPLAYKRTDVVTFSGPIISVIEAHGADPYAATRRAIVRAAAEIGANK